MMIIKTIIMTIIIIMFVKIAIIMFVKIAIIMIEIKEIHLRRKKLEYKCEKNLSQEDNYTTFS